MNILNLEVSKLEAGEYKKVGSIEVPVFSLADFGLDIAETGADEDGLLKYENNKVQYVYEALLAATKAAARNKLVSGTASLKPGSKIAQTVEELIAKAERSSAALAISREFVADFTKFLAEASGKKEAVQALYVAMVKNRQTIAISSEARRLGLQAQLEAFIEFSGAEVISKYPSVLIALSDLCEGSAALDDEDL